MTSHISMSLHNFKPKKASMFIWNEFIIMGFFWKNNKICGKLLLQLLGILQNSMDSKTILVFLLHYVIQRSCGVTNMFRLIFCLYIVVHNMLDSPERLWFQVEWYLAIVTIRETSWKQFRNESTA